MSEMCTRRDVFDVRVEERASMARRTHAIDLIGL
jgi:hypothetical protein